MKSLILLAPWVALSSGATCANLPLPPAITPHEVVCTHDYSEGAVVDRDGNLYFSHGKIISKVTPKGILTQWAETGAPNGHKILPNGHHLICDGQRHAVLELDADGHEVKVAAGSWERQALNMPNDLTLDGKGGFYFTDPGGSSRSHPIGSVYHVAANGSVTRLTTGIAFPNGIVLSKDRKRLYFGESQRNRILFWDLDAKGMPNGDYKVFADLPAPAQPNGAAEPDGMALDAEGRLWIAHFGTGTVRVLSPKGQLLANFPAGNQTVSNLAFGGPKGDQLYITGGDPGCLFRLDVGVKGLPLLPPQRK